MPDRPPRTPSSAYIGRFAPSPTGPLHLGSLVCAVASYLDARAQGGQWLVRIEDLDPPREVPGSTEQILRSLDAHHLFWDQGTLYQSSRHAAYAETLEQLRDLSLTYYCTCTRKDVAGMGGIYDGHCRDQSEKPDIPHAIRFRRREHPVTLIDRIQGEVFTPAEAIDDFILLRKDKLFAYQLAVVVDDAWQNISHVVRGADLLDSTPRQILLQEALGVEPPDWMHIPVLARAGEKLSKQHGAKPIDDREASSNLVTALDLLNQHVPGVESGMAPEEILYLAAEHWRPERISRSLEIEAP